MPPLEVWQKVFVNNAKFVQTVHGKVGCVICHGGDSRGQSKEAAHEGIVADPSDGNCNTCHRDTARKNEGSLHTVLTGFRSKLEARGGDLSEGSQLHMAFNNHCSTCHTTCGQCHVSRPTELGGGLLSEHTFKKTPSMQSNCAACHGARVGDEYLGNNQGIPGDLHWSKQGMTCSKCHGTELHGMEEPAADRYHTRSVKCEDCHQDVWTNTEGNPQHKQHIGDLSCQVCHSVPYKSCYNCHAAVSDKGVPYFTSEPSSIGFKIGRNPIRSSEIPYKYVVLRHVPTNASLFDFYGTNLLPNFDDVSTWKYATPHNIQLKTPQNESCDSCHGNEDLFLTEDDVAPDEREANKDVIVREIPEPRP